MTSDLQQQLQASLGSDFLLERELGGGGMSRVFLAEERRLGRRVVVKVLSPELGAEFSTDRFEREIRLSAQLQDPRIVPLLQAGQVRNLPFYTMPYIEGESLRARLSRAPVPLDEAVAILRDVALALEYAHRRQVVHRDIKPENILLSGRTAVVADFGIAKAITAATEGGRGSTLTSLGGIVGTPAYMAPEQAAGDPVDARTDLYAWGVVAYELLAGVHPFAGHTTAQALLAAHLADPPEPLAQRRPDLPATLTTLVDRCLAKNPNERPADASDLVSNLSATAPASTTVVFRHRFTLAHVLLAAFTLLILGAPAAWAYRRSSRRRWARLEAIPEATRLGAAHRTLAAFLVLTKAQTYLAGDTAIANAIESSTARVSITSSPPGATVAIEDYVTPDSGWFELGTTPLDSVRVPLGYFRWKVAKAGVGDEIVAPLTAKKMTFALDAAVTAPEGMVPVPARSWGDYVAFVGWVGARLPAFYVDKFEVTNRQYQQFVDQGGYTTRKYWTEPFIQDSRTLTWDQAMALFRDRSQRAGPSTWDGGHYPAGQDDYPVSGVSWYEASAYAASVGKTLPTFDQWYEMAPAGPSFLVVGQSNISRSSVAPVGAFKGLGAYGTYDMAGNVREWTMNAFGPDRRFILGGKWDSQSYLYSDPESLSPFDRSPGNGIRCVRNLGPLPPQATAAVTPMERDFTKVHPASDAEFATFRATYAYDATAPLNARVEGVVQDTADWREERVTFDAAYGGQRLAAYLFLPKRVAPPYQTVVFFPSARVLYLTDSRHLGDVSFFDYIVQSGRAVMYPVYQDTYERRQLHSMPGQFGRLTVSVQRSQDLERALDYLETRPDIAADKLAYLGVSAGSAEGVVYATLAQRRLKTVIFLDGGFFLNRPPAAMDQVNFAPRLTLPVLMVNGRYDFTFMLEQSQEPMFRMLGTPAADKRHVVMDTPHDVRNDRPTLVKEVLGWLDKYLGRVQ